MKAEILANGVYGKEGVNPLPMGINELDDKFAEKLIKKGLAREPLAEVQTKEFAVNPEDIKAKAVAEYKESEVYKRLVANSEESLEQLRRLHKEIIGKDPHGKSGAEKIADDILAALEPAEE